MQSSFRLLKGRSASPVSSWEDERSLPLRRSGLLFDNLKGALFSFDSIHTHRYNLIYVPFPHTNPSPTKRLQTLTLSSLLHFRSLSLFTCSAYSTSNHFVPCFSSTLLHASSSHSLFFLPAPHLPSSPPIPHHTPFFLTSLSTSAALIPSLHSLPTPRPTFFFGPSGGFFVVLWDSARFCPSL